METQHLSIRTATEADLPGILAIYNDAVANTIAIWNETLSNLEGRRTCWRERTGRGFPVIVEAGSLASIRLHERFGFREVARMPEVGQKFGRWLDLVPMQRMIR